MTTFGQMGLSTEPVHATLDLGESSCSFGFHERFSFTLFTLSPCLGNEKPTITECAHVIREILMRISLEHVVDAIRRSQIGHQAVRRGTCRTGITALVVAYMRMVL